MKSILEINFSSVTKKLDTTLLRVQRGTKKATIAACEEILAESKQEVPTDTGTLKSSAFYEIQGRIKNFTGIVGYGGNNAVNPNTGAAAEDYMVVVHEDLSASHPNGKAKFLEDPVRRYTAKFAKRASSFIKKEVGT